MDVVNDALRAADKVSAPSFEDLHHFERCVPLERRASLGHPRYLLTMPRWLKVAAALFVALFVMVVVGVRVVCAVVISQQVEPTLERMRADAALYWPAVEADLVAMRAEPFFTRAREGGDAGEQLHEILRWKGGPLDDVPPTDEQLTLDDELADKVSPFELDDKTALPTAEELAALDFGWMKDLERYAYWELSTHPHFAGGGPIDGVAMPIPDFTALLSWSKLRLIDGWRRGELAAARDEVRHLAWLAVTTETLIGGMFGVALLGVEDKARATFSPDEPPAVPTRSALKRVAWALRALGHEGLPADVRARMWAAARGNVGLCVALGEIAFSEPFFRPLLRDHYREAFEERDAVFADPPAPCRMTLARRTQASDAAHSSAIAAEERLVFEILEVDGFADVVMDVVLLRPVRHTVGLILHAIGTPEGYRAYQEETG